jgi:hypothetical protein
MPTGLGTKPVKTNLFQRTCLPIALMLTAVGDAMSCRLVSCIPGQASVMPQDIEKNRGSFDQASSTTSDRCDSGTSKQSGPYRNRGFYLLDHVLIADISHLGMVPGKSLHSKESSTQNVTYGHPPQITDNREVTNPDGRGNPAFALGRPCPSGRLPHRNTCLSRPPEAIPQIIWPAW